MRFVCGRVTKKGKKSIVFTGRPVTQKCDSEIGEGARRENYKSALGHNVGSRISRDARFMHGDSTSPTIPRSNSESDKAREYG